MTILQEVEGRNKAARADDISRHDKWREEDLEKADNRHRETKRIAVWTLAAFCVIAIVAGLISGPAMDWVKSYWSGKTHVPAVAPDLPNP